MLVSFEIMLSVSSDSLLIIIINVVVIIRNYHYKLKCSMYFVLPCPEGKELLISHGSKFRS